MLKLLKNNRIRNFGVEFKVLEILTWLTLFNNIPSNGKMCQLQCSWRILVLIWALTAFSSLSPPHFHRISLPLFPPLQIERSSVFFSLVKNVSPAVLSILLDLASSLFKFAHMHSTGYYPQHSLHSTSKFKHEKWMILHIHTGETNVILMNNP